MLFLVKVLADYLAQVFYGPIRVAAPTTAIGNINSVDFGGRNRAFSSLFLILVAALFFLFFGPWPGCFKRLKAGP